MSTQSTQVDESDIITEMNLIRQETEKAVESELNNKSGWNGLSKIIDLEWKQSLYQNTETIEPSSLKELNGDIAIILNPEVTFNGAIAEEIKVSFPDITTLLRENLEEGTVEYIKKSTETVLSKGKKVRVKKCSMCCRTKRMQTD